MESGVHLLVMFTGSLTSAPTCTMLSEMELVCPVGPNCLLSLICQEICSLGERWAFAGGGHDGHPNLCSGGQVEYYG